MILCINSKVKVEKEPGGTYHLSMPGTLHLNLYKVSPVKTDTCRYYLTLEKGYLFVIERSSGKMVLRGKISSKEQLKDDYIISNWNVYNPPYKKTFYY